MPFFQGASSVNASHGNFNDVTGDQTFTDNSNHSTSTNSHNTTTTDMSSSVTDSSVHHTMGKSASDERYDAYLTNVVDQAFRRLHLSQTSSSTIGISFFACMLILQSHFQTLSDFLSIIDVHLSLDVLYLSETAMLVFFTFLIPNSGIHSWHQRWPQLFQSLEVSRVLKIQRGVLDWTHQFPRDLRSLV